MRIFVTGATGFIGSHFVKRALAARHEVVALRRSPESKPVIDWAEAPQWLDRSLEDVEAADLDGMDCIVHLAATGVSPRVAPWNELLRWNVTAPRQLMGAAYAAGVDRWIVTGTFAEYGSAGLRYEFIPPDAPLEPTYAYAASKAAASVTLRALAAESNARLSYLRLFSVYGEGQHEGNLWPMLRAAARRGDDLPMTPGEQIRDFVAVERVADELLRTAEQMERVQPAVARVRNIGSGEPQTVRQFAETWWRRWEAVGELKFGALPYRHGEVMRYVPVL